jgi:hypothetical protein
VQEGSGVDVGFSVGVTVLTDVCDGDSMDEGVTVGLAAAVFELDTLPEDEFDAADELEEDTVCVLLIAEDALFEEHNVLVLLTVLLADCVEEPDPVLVTIILAVGLTETVEVLEAVVLAV